MSRSEEHTSELQSLRQLVCRRLRLPGSPLFPYTTLFRSRAGFVAPFAEPAPVGELERAPLCAKVVAAVVDQTGGVPIGELVDQVAAPQRDAVEAVAAGGDVEIGRAHV